MGHLWRGAKPRSFAAVVRANPAPTVVVEMQPREEVGKVDLAQGEVVLVKAVEVLAMVMLDLGKAKVNLVLSMVAMDKGVVGSFRNTKDLV